MFKKFVAMLLLGTMLLAGCGSKEPVISGDGDAAPVLEGDGISIQEEIPGNTQIDTEYANPLQDAPGMEDVRALYEEVIRNADAYDYEGFGEPTGYQYAYVQLEYEMEEYLYPTLLIKQSTANGISYVKGFLYDNTHERMLEMRPTAAYIEGQDAFGVLEDGIGLYQYTEFGMDGQPDIRSISMQMDRFLDLGLWQASLGDPMPEVGWSPIEWSDIE